MTYEQALLQKVQNITKVLNDTFSDGSGLNIKIDSLDVNTDELEGLVNDIKSVNTSNNTKLKDVVTKLSNIKTSIDNKETTTDISELQEIVTSLKNTTNSISETVGSFLDTMASIDSGIWETKKIQDNTLTMMGRIYAGSFVTSGLQNIYDIYLNGHTLMPRSTDFSGWSFSRSFDPNNEVYLKNVEKGDDAVTTGSDTLGDGNYFIDTNLYCDLFDLYNEGIIDSVFGEWYYSYYTDGFKYDSSVVKFTYDDVVPEPIIKNTIATDGLYDIKVKNGDKYSYGIILYQTPNSPHLKLWNSSTNANFGVTDTVGSFSNIFIFVFNTTNYYEQGEYILSDLFEPDVLDPESSIYDEGTKQSLAGITEAIGTDVVYGEMIECGPLYQSDMPEIDPKVYLDLPKNTTNILVAGRPSINDDYYYDMKLEQFDNNTGSWAELISSVFSSDGYDAGYFNYDDGAGITIFPAGQYRVKTYVLPIDYSGSDSEADATIIYSDEFNMVTSTSSTLDLMG